MATPRKHWFRVADSVLYDGWDDNQLATMVRLGAYLNTRWAREGRTPDEACRARLDPTDLAKISGKRRRDVALKSLERLANVTGMFVELDGDFVEINWPKWSKFQDLKAPKAPSDPPENAPSADAPATSPAPAEENASAPEAPDSKARARMAWPALAERAAKHGARWASSPGSKQIEAIAARLADGADEVDLERAIEGHVRRNSWHGDPLAHLTATTVYRPTNFEANVEASYLAPASQSGTSEPESAAQAKQRRNREAARAALEDYPDDPVSFAAIDGGRV